VLEAITEVQLKVFLKIDLDLVFAYILIGDDEVKRQDFQIRKVKDQGTF
jgi:hypothetical protein